MKFIVPFLFFLLFCNTTFSQKITSQDTTRNKTQIRNQGSKAGNKTEKSNQEASGIHISPGSSGVKRSIAYRFSDVSEDADPGNGIFRYNNDTLSLVSYIFVDNNDLSGEDQTHWYGTWDDTTGASGRGRISIAHYEGNNVNVFDVSGIFLIGEGFWKIPVRYVSGALPVSGATYYYIFERIAHKKNDSDQVNKETEPVVSAPVESAPDPVVQATAEPAPVVLAPVEPAPVVLAPAEPTPVTSEPLPVVQATVEPAPVVQIPAEPAPVVQVPVEPAPVVQAPAESAPVVKAPVEPAPVVQAPVEPAPVVQTPAEPAPFVPTPAGEIKPQTKPAEQTKPVEQPRSVEQPKPVQQPVTVEQPEPVQQSYPVRQPKPVQQPKPVEQSKPVQQPKPVEQSKPVQQPKPVEQSKPPVQARPVAQVNHYEANQNSQVSVAQNSYGAGRVKHGKCYRGIIEAGYGWGIGDYGINNLRLNFINGFHIGPNFSLGLGIGVRRYFVENEYHTGVNIVSGKVQVPVFLDLRTTLSAKKITPYFAVGIGNSARYTGQNSEVSDSAKSVNEGLFFNPSAGIWINISSRFAVFTGIAYEMQKMEFLNVSDNTPYKKNTSSISINIGISF